MASLPTWPQKEERGDGVVGGKFFKPIEKLSFSKSAPGHPPPRVAPTFVDPRGAARVKSLLPDNNSNQNH